MKAVGLDLSLTGTGIAEVYRPGLPMSPVDSGTTVVRTIKPGARRGYDRLDFIEDAVVASCIGADVVIVEGPSFGSKGSSFHQLAGLWWIITRAVQRDYQLFVAPPSTIKKYATGRGNADKDAMMLMTARRFPDFEGDNNGADALWAAAMGYHRFTGAALTTSVHAEALEKLELA